MLSRLHVRRLKATSHASLGTLPGGNTYRLTPTSVGSRRRVLPTQTYRLAPTVVSTRVLKIHLKYACLPLWCLFESIYLQE